ncbi:MAG: sugar phosphate nucleotidyltransferase [Thermoplasmatota archaeon]
MDAVLLAGGFGTRLRPLTYTKPKPLLPVAGRPMLEWVLDRLPPEVDRVIVAVNWLAEALEAYFDARPEDGRNLRFQVVRETEPLGTAGAVRNALGGEDAAPTEPFYVLNGDILSSMDLAAVAAQHKATGAAATISLKEVPAEDVVHYGVARLDEADARRLRGFVEKPADPADAPSRLINAGAYLLQPEVLDLIPAGRLVSMEKEVFPAILAGGCDDRGLWGVPFEGHWIDVGDPARLRQATLDLGDGTLFTAPPLVDDGAHIDGTIGGSGILIGAGAHVTDCVLGDGVQVAPGARITDCVIGDGEAVGGEHHGERIWTRAPPEGYPQKQVGNALA